MPAWDFIHRISLFTNLKTMNDKKQPQSWGHTFQRGQSIALSNVRSHRVKVRVANVKTGVRKGNVHLYTNCVLNRDQTTWHPFQDCNFSTRTYPQNHPGRGGGREDGQKLGVGELFRYPPQQRIPTSISWGSWLGWHSRGQLHSEAKTSLLESAPW